MRIAIAAIAGFLVLGAAGVTFLWIGFSNSRGDPNDSSEVVFEVHRGEVFASVAKRLADERVIVSAKGFALYCKLLSRTGDIKVGEYSLSRNLKPRDVLERITSGKSRLHKFTIPEGLNIYEIALKFEAEGFGKAQDFLQACFNRNLIRSLLGAEHISLEGYLFPETYNLTKYTDISTFLEMAVSLFQNEFGDLSRRFPSAKFTRHEIVTLASIIEKETGDPRERPLIGSVFYNRMSKDMLLQTDPTVIYGIADESGGQLITNIKREDLRRPTRFNTYTMKGLPPGPIANPGRAALEAALNPANSKMLFFVAKGNGSHYFSENYKDHQKAVIKFQLTK